jgi:outer membrane immunogenic protein
MKSLTASLAALCLSTGLATAEPRSWTGVYGGVHGGLDMAELSAGGPLGISESAIGYGVHGGYDHHFAGTMLVLGMAGDHTWTDAVAIERHWSVTGRAGIAVGNAMPYALAGYKRAEVPGISLDGWVAGGGIEFALSKNLFLGGEYRFSSYDLPTWASGIDAEQHEVRATLKFKLNPF